MGSILSFFILGSLIRESIFFWVEDAFYSFVEVSVISEAEESAYLWSAADQVSCNFCCPKKCYIWYLTSALEMESSLENCRIVVCLKAIRKHFSCYKNKQKKKYTEKTDKSFFYFKFQNLLWMLSPSLLVFALNMQCWSISVLGVGIRWHWLTLTDLDTVTKHEKVKPELVLWWR